MKKPILFVSANSTWGGSEVLWSETALFLAANGHSIKFAVKYDNPIIQKLVDGGASYVSLNKSYNPTILKRLLLKAKLISYPREAFLQAVLDELPKLVIISQGNNVDGRYYMSICQEIGIPFITLTQLVTNILWVFINDDIIDELRDGYAKAIANYFVSKANLDLHILMIGEEHLNSKVISNPFTVPSDVSDEYPEIIDGQYEIALVGRLETFHKGQDLLLQVLKQPKWRSRPIKFNLYGSGPHLQLLKRLVETYQIGNVYFKGHIEDVASVWKKNQMLILPSRMEGQALALIEAMWCFRGAIVTDVGGARELIDDGKTGFIAHLPTFNHIDEALERAWLARDSWREIGYNAGKKIRQTLKKDPIEYFAKEILSALS